MIDKPLIASIEKMIYSWFWNLLVITLRLASRYVVKCMECVFVSNDLNREMEAGASHPSRGYHTLDMVEKYELGGGGNKEHILQK